MKIQTVASTQNVSLGFADIYGEEMGSTDGKAEVQPFGPEFDSPLLHE